MVLYKDSKNITERILIRKIEEQKRTTQQDLKRYIGETERGKGGQEKNMWQQ